MPKRKSMKGKGLSLSDAVNFIKDRNLISSGLGLLNNPYAKAGSIVAKQLGFGKKKRAKKQRGKGIFSDLGGLAYGVGGGIGNIGHGFFGGGRKNKKAISM